MEYRIAICKECGREYNLWTKYGEKCDCGADLFIGTKVITKDYSCVKVWDLNNITKPDNRY